MFDKEKILQQELMNDGQSVFLHYCRAFGKYVAYGWSAYYADMGTTPEPEPELGIEPENELVYRVINSIE